jgi:cephalosporin hydroxylase
MKLDVTLAEQVYVAQKEIVQGHLQALDELVRRELDGDPSTFEGNAFYRDQSFELMNELIPKQVSLFALGAEAPGRICEIGFNAGHSLLLFLLGRRAFGHAGKPVECFVFDINEHVYTEPALAYLRGAFPEATIKFFEGDSIEEATTFVTCRQKDLGTFDLVHVDGGHEEACARSDMACAQKLVRAGGHIIVDDTNDPAIDGVVEAALRGSSRYTEVGLYKGGGLPMYPHRVLQKAVV